MINRTPFEVAENFVHSLAKGFYSAYAMMGYVPTLEELEAQRKEAYQRGDYQLAADLQFMAESVTK